MSATLKFLAFDLGAESGRGVIGHFDGAKLRLEDVHRFPNGGVRCGDTLYWNTFRLWSEIKHGATLAAKQHGPNLAGIGIDTWGVDFGLLDCNGELIGPPVCYRDPRNGPAMAAALRKVPRKAIYASTGLQFMQFNTLFQLYALARKKSPQLDGAATFLMMPDLFNYWFSGKKVCEYSIASTTQFLDARKKTWDAALLKKLGIPTSILPKIVPSGTVLGPLLKSVREETGLGPVPVIAPGCHDTASAVAAVPARGRDHVYISSGTWSLMGAELDAPLINDKTAGYNFTNEGGVCGTVRFLRTSWASGSCNNAAKRGNAPARNSATRNWTGWLRRSRPRPRSSNRTTTSFSRPPTCRRRSGHSAGAPARRFPTTRASSCVACCKAWRSNTAGRWNGSRNAAASARQSFTSSGAVPIARC